MTLQQLFRWPGCIRSRTSKLILLMALAGGLSTPAFAINLQPGFDTGNLPAGQITTDCHTWSGNLSCAQANQQAVDNKLDQLIFPTQYWTPTGTTLTLVSPYVNLDITGTGTFGQISTDDWFNQANTKTLFHYYDDGYGTQIQYFMNDAMYFDENATLWISGEVNCNQYWSLDNNHYMMSWDGSNVVLHTSGGSVITYNDYGYANTLDDGFGNMSIAGNITSLYGYGAIATYLTYQNGTYGDVNNNGNWFANNLETNGQMSCGYLSSDGNSIYTDGSGGISFIGPLYGTASGSTTLMYYSAYDGGYRADGFVHVFSTVYDGGDMYSTTGHFNEIEDYNNNSILATYSSGWTITNAKVTKRVDSSQTGVTTIAVNSDSYDVIYATDTAAAGTLTISADTGATQTEGQSVLLKIKCTNIQTFSWTSGAKGYYGGNMTLPTQTSGSSKTDYYSFVWDSVTSHWLFTGGIGGF